jgi:hypothetical protein
VVLAFGATLAENWAMVEKVIPTRAATRAIDARPRTGCYVCRFHGGELDNGHIVCARPPDPRTMGYAARGCCYWQREPGADDE